MYKENAVDECQMIKSQTYVKLKTILILILSLVLLLISNLTNGLRLHQFLVTKSAEANKSVKTDANRAH